MANITYPPKPWSDGQRASLISGLNFMYSASLKKWVPITPAYTIAAQLEEGFGVSSLVDLEKKYAELELSLVKIDSQLDNIGQIWKSEDTPVGAKINDIWIDFKTGRTFYYVITNDTWIEFNHKTST